MEIAKIEIQGFRRFQTKSVLRLSGKVTALVGPNEAGKSSLLEAVSLLNDDEPISPEAVSRGASAEQCRIRAYFLLDADDLHSIGYSGPRWFFIQKEVDGARKYGFEPTLPLRHTKLREKLHSDIISISSKPDIVEELNVEDESFAGDAELLLKALHGGGETLSSDKIRELKALSARLSNLVGKSSHKSLRTLEQELKILIKQEDAATPFQTAYQAIYKKIPKFLLFDDEQREIASDYQISDLQDEPSSALINLLSLAGLEIEQLLSVMQRGVNADITSVEHRANSELEKQFGDLWGQSGVNVSLRINPSLLAIQIVNEAGEFSALQERSDGLRQFVALQAFAQKHGTSQIVLLIDEAENRLHYDAQADLIYMLTKQSSATRVIFTTHSAGCLPQDLGRGVKLIEVDKTQKTRSRIVNKFWAQSQKGLTPLLIGMGAATLAFFPTRKAVMVEGASDLLLLPRLLSEASGSRMFEFQLIPGLSSQGPALAHIAIQSEKHILYLVDSDGGGDQLTTLLKNAKIPQNRIFRVGYSRHVKEPEDFIEPAALIEATNNLIGQVKAGAPLLSQADLRSEHRMESLELAFRNSTNQKLLKVDLAYELLALVDANPDRTLSDARRRAGILKLWEALNTAFAEPDLIRA